MGQAGSARYAIPHRSNTPLFSSLISQSLYRIQPGGFYRRENAGKDPHKNAEGKGMAVRLTVREIAEQKGYNISTLSRKADVGLSTVRRLWHDPYRHVDFYVLERLAKALEVPVTALIEDVPDE